VSLETSGGVVRARVEPPGPDGAVSVGVEVAAPRDLRLDLALPPGSPAASGDYAVVGVPYVAVPVPDVDGVDLARCAPPLRRWSAFPEGANVSFYELPSGGSHVRLRTWERGVEGETLSSGTGCAMTAISVAHRTGLLRTDGQRTLAFAPRAGIRLEVTLAVRAGAVTDIMLRGDARLVAAGTLFREGMTGFDLD
jgi:diaminopimelate epimerase